jgi:DNA-binding transcriptional LysR family regulator
MSAAGREMGLSPAVVSKRISLLEEKLGARLFQRTTRHLTLTETGEGYYRRVIDILSLLDEAHDFVSRRNVQPRGLLKVTAPTSFSRFHIAPYISAFQERFPEIELDFQLSDHFVDLVREGFDAAIRIGELQDSSLVARKLASDTRVLCAAPSYIAKHGAPHSIDEIETHNLLSASSQDKWRLEGPGGAVHQLRSRGNIRSNSSDFIREAIISGLGIGLRSTWDIGPELRNGSLQVVMPEWRGSSNMAIFAVYPSRDYMPAKVNALIDFLGETYGSEPYWDRALDLPAVSAAATDNVTRLKSVR